MHSLSTLRAVAGHHGIYLQSASKMRSRHTIADAFTRNIFTLTASCSANRPGALGTQAVAHQQSNMLTRKPRAIADHLMNMHYQPHTRNL